MSVRRTLEDADAKLTSSQAMPPTQILSARNHRTGISLTRSFNVPPQKTEVAASRSLCVTIAPRTNRRVSSIMDSVLVDVLTRWVHIAGIVIWMGHNWHNVVANLTYRARRKP